MFKNLNISSYQEDMVVSAFSGVIVELSEYENFLDFSCPNLLVVRQEIRQ